MHSKYSSASSFLSNTFNTPTSLKLDDDNFLLLRQQVLATIRGLKLLKFLNGQSLPPKYKTPEDAHANTINQNFLNYKQQDQLLVSWLLASMTTLILRKW